ncbi:MAG: histidine kinase [Sedimenticola sp.]|nr:MAG: histidine kinase [Sedimenticola sp.]
MIRSIHARVQLAATLVLAAFLGLGAIALDRAFRSSLEEATQERLMGQVYALLSAAKDDELGRITLPEILPDPRLGRPDSGLYAQVQSPDLGYAWGSASLLGREISFPGVAATGVPVFQRASQPSGDYYTLSYQILWADNSGAELTYLFSVAEDTRALGIQIAAFRRTLFLWLGGVSLFLLIAQGLVLRWGLRPLREVAEDLEQIELGKSQGLSGDYPKELTGLAHRINSLIESGRASQARYRNSLGDLAHSLKTPLAVLQGAAEQPDGEKLKAAIGEQVPRMNEIVKYQLKRAAASGFTGIQQGIRVLPVARRLLATLDKVYREKPVSAEVEGPDSAEFRGDENDLMEMLGNLLENAYKYGRAKVRVRVVVDPAGKALEITIEDDGEGIPVSLRETVLRRGQRADQRQAGQGIGLSVADEIVRLYQGQLTIGDSQMGGALLKLTIPTH